MERTARPQINPFGLPHITIPAEVLFHPELTPREKMLFGFIWNLTRSAEGMFSCWASNRYLGELLQVKPETISGAVANLQKHGFIIVQLGRRGDGMVTRDIFINDNYIHENRRVLLGMAERFKDLRKNRRPPLEKSGTPPMNIGDPPDKSLGQLDRELGKGKKEKDISLPENPPVVETSPEDTNWGRYLILSKKLRRAVRSKKKVNVTDSRCAQWGKEIKRLVEKDLVGDVDSSIERVRCALDFYEKNIGGQYIPVIESGASLREKFTKLEAAMGRAASNGDGSGRCAWTRDPSNTREKNPNLRLSDPPRPADIHVTQNF